MWIWRLVMLPPCVLVYISVKGCCFVDGTRSGGLLAAVTETNLLKKESGASYKDFYGINFGGICQVERTNERVLLPNKENSPFGGKIRC